MVVMYSDSGKVNHFLPNVSSVPIKEESVTIEKLNIDIEEMEKKVEAARLLAICLDDSDDENPDIIWAESTRKGQQPYIRHLLRERGFFGRLSWKLKRSWKSNPVRVRRVLTNEMETCLKVYEDTSERRLKYNITSYGFGGTAKGHAKSGLVPTIKWTVKFEKMPKLLENDLYNALEFDMSEYSKWWKMKGPSTDSDGWSDMRKLARKVVFILEKIHHPEMEMFMSQHQLIDIGERSREIMFFLLTLISTFPERSGVILRVFEFSGPIFFLLYRIVESSLIISKESPTGQIELNRIGRQLRLIDLCIRELGVACYTLGVELGFDASDYLKREEELQFPEHGQSGEVKNAVLKGCLAYDKDKRAEILENIHESQLQVKQNLEEISVSSAETKADILDIRELEKLGLVSIDVSEETCLLKGEGGYAVVYEMKWTNKDKHVAVKIFHSGSATRRRIMREASTWVNLKHELILPLLGFTILPTNPQPCLVSKLCWGNLKDYVKYRAKRVPLSVERKLQFIRDVIFGLDYLHGQDIAHGDLRAVNVLVTEDSDNEKISSAVLNDFGMSDDTDRSQPRAVNLTSVNQRTNDYWIAPELMLGKPQNGIKSRVSKAGDIYALGVVFLEVVCEKEPYEHHPEFVQIAKMNGVLPATHDKLQVDDSHWHFMERSWKAVDERWNVTQAGAEIIMMLNARETS